MKQHMSKQSRVRGSKEITQKSMKMRTEYTETCGKQGRRQIYDTKCPQQERGKGRCSKFLPSRSQQKQKQQNDKAITTPASNAQLGEYFRKRLKLNNGAYVHAEDLIAYGRTDVTFYKIDDEQFYMDFSVDKGI